MGKGRFLNQKLGKKMSRKSDLMKSRIAGRRSEAYRSASDLRLPKKGASRRRTP
jgi:hypothetical protein